jgi:leucyl-tRNA synthetase
VIVGPSESMSKSKKNTIDPENIIENFGADAVRLFIISDSPPEKDVQWSDEGIEASYKFILKLWNLHSKISNEIKLNRATNEDDNLDRITNKFLNDIESNLEKFRYNKIIANFYEVFASYSKLNLQKYSALNIKNNYSKILIAMMPVIPHFSNECIKLLNITENIQWPEINQANLIQDSSKYVIQVNGKTRKVIEDKKNITKDELITVIKKDTKLYKYIKDDTKIKKIIFIPNKLINVIL